MSGIFGIMNLGNRAGQPVDAANLRRMREALKHRGRDGSGYWNEDGVGLGHLATNITPESPFEKLPFTSPGGRFVITADARIDNREELMDILSIPHPGRGEMPDGVLILEAFRKWGTACPAHLLGQFAFAIWDRREKQLFCARDHLGGRPFFYYRWSNLFVFASQIKGVRATGLVPLQFNETALVMKMFPVEALDHRETYFKDIFRLKAANRLTLEVKENKLSFDSYWDPRECKPVKYARDSDYAEALQEMMVRAVHRNLRTLPHIEVAVALSGGLDSSAIACIAARKLRESGKRLTAVSSVLPADHTGIETDERQFIRAVLEQEPNIDIRYVTGEGTGPLDWASMEAGIREIEAPVTTFHHMNRALCNSAVEAGAHILLWGMGGDSITSHDGRYSLFLLVKRGKWGKAFKLMEQIKQVEHIPLIRIAGRHLLAPIAPGWLLDLFKWIKHGKKTNKKNNPATFNYAGRYGFKLGRQVGSIRKSPATPNRFFFRKHASGRFQIESENIRQYHLGLSAGFPCWDRQIVEFSLGVPPEQFLAGGWQRGLFRRAMEGILPPAIQWRRDKHVFAPDFHRRLMQAKPEISHFLDSIKENEQVHRVIDLRRIKNHLDHIRPVTGRKDWDSEAQAVVMKGIIYIKFLHWMDREIEKRKNIIIP